MTEMEKMGQRAKEASSVLAVAGKQKKQALIAIADALVANKDRIIAQNDIDIKNGKENGLTESLLDRLKLTDERIEGMAQGVRKVADFDDPIGQIITGRVAENGMEIKKVRVPMGVIGIIFEARPNVTSDAAALCLMAGNAVILRGGKEAIYSNTVISDVMREAIESAGLPADCVQLVKDTTRQSSVELMGLSDYLDVLIPRGGAGLIKAVVENSKVPVIETGVGNCHAVIDKCADIDMAVNIVFNGKTQRPSVCNALETVLVHKDIAETALKALKSKLDEKNVEIHGCERTKAILGDCVIDAEEYDWANEYLDLKIAIKVVDSLDDAIAHIRKYSTGHSEVIITNDYMAQNKFTAQVDSSAVYVNASTRFTDGGEFGMGAEIGISTQKLHARGPMGLTELTSMKYVISGDGQVR
ncbi:MAG: glutamate-5-semialdehyde dehydrogenase [Clostridia bacterium]|nr:glutamate-5-semialdehyde dehydrogenase [Clostridia bacterium]MEE1124770.1 glutamate-5-semialdehyde dehydrogenase [Acutalibacteraceae bacterium]